MQKVITLNLYKEKRLLESFKDINSIFSNNTYTFFIDGIKTTLSDKIFIRENNEYKFILDINKKEAIYNLKEINKLFNIEVTFLNLKKENKNLTLEYKLSSEEQKIKIELKEN